MKQSVAEVSVSIHRDLPIELTFDAPRSSSDGGLVLLRQVDERLGLTRWFSALLPDKRDPGRVVHARREQVQQRIYQIAMGYEDCNDADHLRHDPMLKVACDRDVGDGAGLSSQPTLSRYENAVPGRALRPLMEGLEDSYVASLPAGTDVVVLDVDATDDRTYGAQQLTFFNAHYNSYIYLPLLIFDGETGELASVLLRRGNVGGARGAGAILERLIRKIKARFPEAQVLVRADAGFCVPRDLDRYERLDEELGGIDYLIGVQKNTTLKGLLGPTMAEAERQHEESGRAVQVFTDFQYKTRVSWAHPRHVVGKAEWTLEGSNPRFVVTSLAGFEPRLLYRMYCERGRCENCIKDLKNALNADRLSCTSFKANFFRLLEHAAAYRLMHALRTQARQVSAELGRAQFDTLRLKLLKVAALVTQSARRLLVRLPRSFPMAAAFAALATRLAVNSS